MHNKLSGDFLAITNHADVAELLKLGRGVQAVSRRDALGEIDRWVNAIVNYLEVDRHGKGSSTSTSDYAWAWNLAENKWGGKLEK